MLLSVELKDRAKRDQAEVVLCFDEEGLTFLIEKLTRLRGRKDHEHLMTPAWAGNELTEIKQGGSDHELVNHLRLVKV